jgi:hypothetical protein
MPKSLGHCAGQERRGLGPPRPRRPRKRLCPAHHLVRHSHFWHNLHPVRILGAHYIDGREECGYRHEERCVRDELAGTDASAGAESHSPRVAHGWVKLTLGCEKTLWFEALRLGIVVCVVQDAPVDADEGMFSSCPQSEGGERTRPGR